MSDLLSLLYPWIKALHIVAVMSWMAGMFYLPRLFVYHAERGAVGTEMHATFMVMERKLLKLIMTPAMIAAWLFGLLLVLTPGVVDWGSGWPWVKVVAVLAMSSMHGWLETRRKEFGANLSVGQ